MREKLEAHAKACREALDRGELRPPLPEGLYDLRGADLTRADLTGADLTEASLRRADLHGADLHGANLTGADLTGADLTKADLTKADLSGAYLSGADLTKADLTNANLTGTDLTKADLTKADLTGVDWGDAPLVPDLHRRVAEAVGPEGAALDMAEWHQPCGTTHCRAGWAVELAGPEGKALEDKLGPGKAGALIYARSTGMVPNFYADNDEALADIKACAEAG